MINSELDVVDNMLEEAKLKLNQHRPVEAEELLKNIIDSIVLQFEDDEETCYMCISDKLHYVIFRSFFDIDKNIRTPSYNFAEIYYLYGYTLIENGKLDEAEKALIRSREWDPVSLVTIAEQAEIYKMRKSFDKYLELTREAMRYAVTPKEIARVYRNLGYYYIETEDHDTAAALYYLMSAHQPRKGFTAKLEGFSRLQKCKEKHLIYKFSLHFCPSAGRNELDIKECVRCKTALKARFYSI